MKIYDILVSLKGGDQICVTMPGPTRKHPQYSLLDGTPVSRRQFRKIKVFVKPIGGALFSGVEPTAYGWDDGE